MRTRVWRSLASQLVLVQLILIGAVLVAVSAVSVEQTRRQFLLDQGRRTLALAENLAARSLVRSGNFEVVNDATLPGATTQLQQISGAELVLITDPTGKVLAGTDPTLLDEPVAWPELAAAPGRSHTATTELGGRSYLISAAPVLIPRRSTGRYASSASPWSANSIPRAWMPWSKLRPTLITYLGAAMVLGVVGSLLLARWIKRQTFGLEPAEMAALVEQREAIFTGIAEGVIALDSHDRVTMVNPLAAQLLSLPAEPVGQSLDELAIEGRLREVLTGASGAERDAVVIRRGRVLVLNRMPVIHDNRTIGSVTTLRDRTQLAELEQEIGAFRGTTDLLRAQTHEFANQLHTISGLIQIGDYDEVVSYVDALTEGRAAVDLTVARRVKDPSVAALLVAKSAVAAERKVALRISAQTNLDPLEPSCSYDVATVLGNLISNGIDAAAGHAA